MRQFIPLLLLCHFLLIGIKIQAQYLQVSENSRYLIKDDGTPFFWLGDTAWELFHRLNRDEIDYYLRNRASKGFNVVQCVILSEINGLTVPNREGNLPLVNLDPEQPNEAYFELVDYAVSTADKYGIYLAMLPTWGAHVEDKESAVFDNLHIFDQKNAKDYGSFLGKRYRSSWNVIWVLGGDRPADEQLPLWEAMAEGLTAGSGGKQLMTYHPRGQQSSSFWLHNKEWLDFNMLQTGHQEPGFPVYDWIAHDYALTPVKPVLNAEPAYEDMGYWFNPVNGRYDAYHVRKNAYWCVFAGAFGHTYGNNNIWQMYREEYQPVIWARIPWNEALEQPGASQMRHLRNLIASRPMLSRIPDQNLLINPDHKIPVVNVAENQGLSQNPSSSTDHIRITRDGTNNQQDATYIMIYLPYYKTFTVSTSVIEGKELNVWWYNPRTGEVIPGGKIPNTGSFSHSNWSPWIKEEQGGPDWVVVLDDAGKGYQPPGKSPGH